MPRAGSAHYSGGWHRDTRGPQIAARRFYHGGMLGSGPSGKHPGGSFEESFGPAFEKGAVIGANAYYQHRAQEMQNAMKQKEMAQQLAIHQATQARLDQDSVFKREQIADAEAKQQSEEDNAKDWMSSQATPEEQHAAMLKRYGGVTMQHSGGAGALDPQTQQALDALPPAQRQQALLNRAHLVPTAKAAKDDGDVEQLKALGEIVKNHHDAMTAAAAAGDQDTYDQHAKELQTLQPLLQKLQVDHFNKLGGKPGSNSNLQLPSVPDAKVQQFQKPAAVQGSPAAAAAGQQQQQQQKASLTPEQLTGFIGMAAEEKGIKPEDVGKLPALNSTERMQIKNEVQSRISDPIKAQQEMLRRSVLMGRDPRKPPIGDPLKPPASMVDPKSMTQVPYSQMDAQAQPQTQAPAGAGGSPYQAMDEAGSGVDATILSAQMNDDPADPNR